jgi:glutathione S-transferase
MLKIWGRTTSSNVQKVLWCCAELGIEYERVDLGGPFGGNRDPEYLAMNPNGRVPTISDDGLILWESNTICRYLTVTRQGERLYPAAPAARAKVERWTKRRSRGHASRRYPRGPSSKRNSPIGPIWQARN